MTKEIVQERLKGDAWIIWAVAQRASVPLKVEACIEYVANRTLFDPLLTAILASIGRG
jgi:hypothetical protein